LILRANTMSIIRISKNPSARQLAVFAAAWFVFLGLSGIACWHRGRHPAADALWVLAAGVPLAGAVDRRILRHAFVGLSYATYPIGVVVSHVVLAIVFFLVLSPIGLAVRLLGHDPLARGFDRGAKSYWRRRDMTKPVGSYFNQD
jgi:hypothetical protein